MSLTSLLIKSSHSLKKPYKNIIKKRYVNRLNYEIYNELLFNGYQVHIKMKEKEDLNVGPSSDDDNNNITTHQDSHYDFELHIDSLRHKRVHYIVKLNDDYPFRKPDLYLNNIYYPYVLPGSSKEILHKLFGIDCLCCHSRICSWDVTTKIIDLILEAEEVIQIKKRMVEIIHARVIQRKYLPPYVHVVEEFL